MTKLINKPAVRRVLSTLVLAIAFGFGLSLHGVAVAQVNCVADEGKPTEESLTFAEDQDIRSLIASFYEELDKVSATPATRELWLEEVFTDKFTFEVCTGGGNNSLFLAVADFPKLKKRINENYAALQKDTIKPTHAIYNVQLTRVGIDTVLEKSLLLMLLQTPDPLHGPFLEYSAEIRGTITRKNEKWRFEKRFVIIDTPTIVSFAR